MNKFVIEKRNNDDAEQRTSRFTADELRAEERKDDAGKPIYRISGYAVRYDSRSENLGGFTEIIEQGAFDHILAGEHDVRCLFNHDFNQVLGRTKSGTLKLTSDKKGLRMECDLPNTAQARSVFESIKRGDVNGQSFAFAMYPDGEDEWSPDFSERRIKKVAALYDVGPVTFPAYPSASVGAAIRAQAMHQRKPIEPQAPTPAVQTTERTIPVNWKEMMKRAAELVKAADAIKTKAVEEKRDLSADEFKSIAETLEESNTLRSQAETLKKLEEANASLREPENRRTEPPAPQHQQRTAVQVVSRGTSRYYSPVTFGTRQAANEAAYRVGQWALAQLFGNTRSREWCMEHGVDLRAQMTTSNEMGGHLVPDEMENTIIRLIEEHGVARPNCRQVNLTSGTISTPVNLGGLKARPMPEGADAPAGSMKFGAVPLSAKKWGLLVPFSSELSEDAVVSIADAITADCAEAFREAEDDALFNGDGGQDFYGITGLDLSLIGKSIFTLTSQTSFASVTDAKISEAVGLLPKTARVGAKIYTSVTAAESVFGRLMRAAGGNTQSIVAGEPEGRYYGMPLVTSSLIDDTGTTGKLVAYIGNLSQAASFGNRRQMTLKSSEHAFFAQDMLAILATERFDINVWNVGTKDKAGPLIKVKLG